MRALAILFVLGTLASIGSAEEKRDDREGIQGVWRGRAVEVKGLPSTLSSAVGMVLRFEKNTFTIEHEGKVAVRGTFALDPSHKPKTIDFTIEESLQASNKGAQVWGIYKLDKDELRLCTTKANGQDRPKRFSTKQSVPHTLFAFQREKAEAMDSSKAK